MEHGRRFHRSIEREPGGLVNQPQGRLLLPRNRTTASFQRACLAKASQVSTTVSGLSEMLSIFCSTSHWARSGWSDGPWPQIPAYFFALRHAVIAIASIALTASSRSSNVDAIAP